MWDDDSLSQYDGQICFEDGTCMDTRDLPDDFSLPEYLDEFARSTQGDWVDTWQTAQGFGSDHHGTRGLNGRPRAG